MSTVGEPLGAFGVDKRQISGDFIRANKVQAFHFPQIFPAIPPTGKTNHKGKHKW
jgi:hypothetical protein